LKGSFDWANSDDAMLLGWSMTKSILNALIGIRVRQGKMSLDQKALFPEWCQRSGDERCDITILQLLQMSSGLNFDETYGAFGGATQMLFANNDIAKFAIGQGYDKGMRYFCNVAPV
jgi:CubicO group peptidase (beta-lactamase class C family)